MADDPAGPDPDEPKWQALRDEMSRPTIVDNISYLYEGRDILEPEQRRRGVEHEQDDGTWRSTYADSPVYSDLTDAELDDPTADLLFEPYTGDDGPGWLATRRGA